MMNLEFPRREGAPTNYLAKLFPKLHENERNWMEREANQEGSPTYCLANLSWKLDKNEQKFCREGSMCPPPNNPPMNAR